MYLQLLGTGCQPLTVTGLLALGSQGGQGSEWFVVINFKESNMLPVQGQAAQYMTVMPPAQTGLSKSPIAKVTGHLALYGCGQLLITLPD